MTVVFELEESRSSFDLGLDDTGRSDFEETDGFVGSSEFVEKLGSDLENVGGGFTSNDEMSGVG